MRISDWSSDVCSSDLFLREQLLHEVGVRAAEENLRTAVLAAHRQNQRADAVADAHQFARDLLVAADHAFGTAEVDDDVAEFDRLDDAGDDLARAVLIFLELAFAVGFADLLEDHLFCRLRVDAAQVDRGQRIDDEVADLGVLLQLLASREVDLLEIILDLLDHLDDAPQAQVAGLDVELGANIVLGAVAGARSALDRFLDRLDHDDLVDHLLAGDAVGNRQQFGAVGGNGSGHQSCPSSSISSAPSVESGTVAAINLSVRTSFAVSIASNGSLCSTPS